MKILIIEDEWKIAQALKQGLEEEHYEVAMAHSGEDGFFLAQSEEFDLLILDLMLPGRDGLEVLRTIRKLGGRTKVLILTARDTIEDRVVGLDAGADDYLVKPFSFPELLARVRALLRRGVQPEATSLILADLEMDLLARRVVRGGEVIYLTNKEFSLLECLLNNQGRIVSREMLSREVWGEQARATSLDNVIDVHVARLRKRLDRPGLPKLLHTVRGIGFLLSEEMP